MSRAIPNRDSRGEIVVAELPGDHAWKIPSTNTIGSPCGVPDLTNPQENSIKPPSLISSGELPSIDKPTEQHATRTNTQPPYPQSGIMAVDIGRCGNELTDAKGSSTWHYHNDQDLTKNPSMSREQPNPRDETSAHVQSVSSGLSNPARYDLHKIETKLDQIMALVPDCEVESFIEDESDPEEYTGSYPLTLRMHQHSPSASSCSSATSSYMPSISSCQTNGSGNSSSSSSGSNAVSPNSSTNGQGSLPSSATNPTFGSDGRPRDDESDELNGKSPKPFPGFLTPDSEGSLEKQIPCFVDNCNGKDRYVSEVMFVVLSRLRCSSNQLTPMTEETPTSTMPFMSAFGATFHLIMTMTFGAMVHLLTNVNRIVFLPNVGHALT